MSGEYGMKDAMENDEKHHDRSDIYLILLNALSNFAGISIGMVALNS